MRVSMILSVFAFASTTWAEAAFDAPGNFNPIIPGFSLDLATKQVLR